MRVLYATRILKKRTVWHRLGFMTFLRLFQDMLSSAAAHVCMYACMHLCMCVVCVCGLCMWPVSVVSLCVYGLSVSMSSPTPVFLCEMTFT